MFRAACIVLTSCLVIVSGNKDPETNEISSRSIPSADRLVSSVILDCLDGQQSAMRCVRVKTLEYLETVMPSKRALKTPAAEVEDDGELDSRIGERVQRYIDTHQFKVQLPELFFQGATLVFTPGKSLLDFDVEFPQRSDADQLSIDEGRDMKKNMLLPLLMLIKLKLKTIIPILLTIVHVKATKALIMSKLAILLVGGFLAFQILQKKQMMQMMMSVEPTPAPSSAYGPPAPTYGPPTNSYGPPSSTVSSYEAPIYDVPSSWEPSPPQGPYARVGWDAQSMAYNGYTQATNQQSSTS